MFCAASISKRASACASAIMEREQPFGHHQSQRYMLYIQADEDGLHDLQQVLVQTLEYLICEV